MKIKFYGLITVRSNSERLNNKCFLKFGNINVLEHIILRCKHGGITPIICTSNNNRDNKIVKIAKKLKIKFFRGPEKNKILRWYLCCKKFKIKTFHTVDADDPYFDWDAIIKSIIILKNNKLDIVLPSKISRDGAASEGYSFKFNTLKKIIKKNPLLENKNYDSEMIESFIKKNLKTKRFKGNSYQLKKIRLTLDYKEDYKLFKKILENLGNFCHRKEINSFLLKNKKLIKINYFKNYFWARRQKKLISNTY